ncbi:MAG: hypothetical protein ACI915_003458 [Gammaproteobacteria bacterium]|jgi:hypothetical protein
MNPENVKTYGMIASGDREHEFEAGIFVGNAGWPKERNRSVRRFRTCFWCWHKYFLGSRKLRAEIDVIEPVKVHSVTTHSALSCGLEKMMHAAI